MRYSLSPFLLIILGLWFLLMTTNAKANNAAKEIFYSTQAFDSRTGSLVYAEKHHYVETDKGLQSATVEYFAPDGTLVAEKKIDFSASPESPFFVRENKQTGYREGYEALSTTQPYKGRLFQQQADEAAACDDVVALRPGMIVDAGFNVHLKNNMGALQAGQTLTFDLLIPKACRALEFNASGQVTEKGLLISLKPTSLLARLVVPNTEVLYDPETRNLLEYHGLSDLTNAEGRSMKVSIYFEDPVVKRGAALTSAEQGQNAAYGKRSDTEQAVNNGGQ